MPKILIIEDEENLRFSIRRALVKAGHAVFEASCLHDARVHARQHEFDLVLTDIMLGDENGIEFIREMRHDGYEGVAVVMTAHATLETAVQAMREGADDYLTKPLVMNELTIQVDRWLEQQRVARRLKLYERIEQSKDPTDEIVGNSPAWIQTLTLARRLATIPISIDESGTRPGDSAATGGIGLTGSSLPCILLLGETGVGKGVLARFIHLQAIQSGLDRKGKREVGVPPFVHVNCSALPASLVEAELFGHEKGAFTDASEARAGLFEMADGGTIFLDEISEMTQELQAKLLLVVEHGVFRRVGGSKERTVRARVIAASNQDLDQRAQTGAFRRDLLYRLNAFTLRIPPLRDREGDAVLAADTMLERFSRRYGREGLKLSDASRDAVRRHPWPGNVRELVNAVQRAAMLSEGPVIEPVDLGLVPIVGQPEQAESPRRASGELIFDFEHGVHNADEVEKALIQQALEYTKGNVSRAAKLIGLQRSSFRYRIDRYQLDKLTTEVGRQ